MNKEEFLKIVSEIPKTETNSCISSYNSVNVEELANAVDRFKKIPDYNDLLLKNNKLENDKDNLIKYLEDKTKKLKDECASLGHIIDKDTMQKFDLQINAYQDVLERIRNNNYEL